MTLEAYRAIEDERRRAEERARNRRVEHVVTEQIACEPQPPPPSVRRFDPRPDWRWPESRVFETDGDTDYEADERDIDGDLLESDDLIIDERADDEYDYLVFLEPTEEEEDRATVSLYGLPAGHFAREEEPPAQGNPAEFARQRVREQADRMALELRAEIEEGRADGDPRFADDTRERCQNPNGRDQPVKGRSTRCSACYKYRSNSCIACTSKT